jgi:hypothetical protein
MPVLLAGREPDDITGPGLLDRFAFALDPAEASRDDESLTERMCVPCRPRARLEYYAGALNKCRIRCLKKRIDPYSASEPVGGSFSGRLSANSLDFHICFFSLLLRVHPKRHSPSGRLLNPLRIPSPFDLDV